MGVSNSKPRKSMALTGRTITAGRKKQPVKKAAPKGKFSNATATRDSIAKKKGRSLAAGQRAPSYFKPPTNQDGTIQSGSGWYRMR